MSDSEDDRQQQGSNEQRQRQQQQEESDMRGGEVRAGSRSYAVEILQRFGPDLPTGGAKCDPPRVVIAQWACSGLGARVAKFGAMALALLPVPGALVAVFHPTIRIGPVRHNYIYHLHSPGGVYRCERCSEWGLAGDRLFLFRQRIKASESGPGPGP